MNPTQKHHAVSALALSGLLLWLGACDFKRDKGYAFPVNGRQGRVDPRDPNFDAETLSYALVRDEVFTPRCKDCHSHNHKWAQDGGSYEKVLSHLDAIRQRALIDRDMPQDAPPLSDSEYALLDLWIRYGAPELPGEILKPSPSPSPSPEPSASPLPEPSATPSPEPSLSPTPSPIPLEPTFESLKANVFGPKCIGCHVAKDVKNDSDEEVFFNSEDELVEQGEVIFGKLEKSVVYDRITLPTTDKQFMPKSSEVGQPPQPLSAVEIETIKKWILRSNKR